MIKKSFVTFPVLKTYSQRLDAVDKQEKSNNQSLTTLCIGTTYYASISETQ